MESVLIVAGEASSALYAQRLLEGWQEAGRKVEAFGVGNRAMEKLGFECIGRSEEMAVVGLQEVIKHLPLIRKVFNGILREVESRKPSFALLLDYPDFNLRLAKQLKKRGVKVIYYISPQVWAWRTGRVHTIKKIVDQMLVVFPFEEGFYRGFDVNSNFVGHPLLDELPKAVLPGERQVQRSRFGLGPDDVVLGLMPGSRKSEIEHHLKTQIETAGILVSRYSRLRPVILVAPTLDRSYIREAMGDVGFPIQLIKENPMDMIDLADVILVASGTATLMVGLLEKPMVIMYKMNSVTAWFAKRLVTETPFFGMANLILNERVVPELFQDEANPKRLALEIGRFIDDQVYREKTIDSLRGLKSKLGSKGATRRVLDILNNYFRNTKAGSHAAPSSIH
jgi:lipid-A-disaccharide synthase